MRTALALSMLVSGCYLSHARDADAAVDAPTRCGARSCALASRGTLRITVDPPAPPLPRRFEANVLSLEAGPDDGIRIVAETCPGGCVRSLLVSRVGSDRADPAVLSGPAEVSLRDQALVMRADPCPGCDDGGVAAQLLLAAVTGELREDDLPLRDVLVQTTRPVCESSGPFAEQGARFRIAFSGTVGRTFELDEGETRGLGGDHAARVLHSHYDCLSPDVLPPTGLEASSWIIYAIGPR